MVYLYIILNDKHTTIMRRQKLTAAQIAQVSIASALGALAFEKGQQRVPHFDLNMGKLMEGNAVGESIPALKAWCAGWDSANLA